MKENTKNKAKTGSANGFRVVKDGIWEPKQQQAQINARMFQFIKSKKGGRKK